MKQFLLHKAEQIRDKFFFLNRFLVPFVFLYFVLMILPSIFPQITFLPNIFASGAFATAYKALVFVLFFVYVILLSIVNKTKIDWRFFGPMLGLGLLTSAVILLTPKPFIFNSVSDDHVLVEIVVNLSWGNRVSALAECWANLTTAYAFLVILPKAVFFRKQLSKLVLLFLLFVTFSYVYSLIFEFQAHLASLLDLDPNAIIQGFFDHKNTFGKYLLLGIMLSVFMYHESRKKVYLLFIPVFLLGLFTIRSRTSLGIAGLFILGSVVYQIIREWNRHRQRSIIQLSVFGGALLLGAAFLWIPFLAPLWDHTDLYKYIHSFFLSYGFSTIDGRLTIYRHVVDLLSSWPRFLFGYGDHLANIYLDLSTSIELLESNQTSAFHNGMLDVLAKGGVFRLIAYIFAIGYVLRQTFKLRKKEPFLFAFTILAYLALFTHSLLEATVFLEASAWGVSTGIIAVLIPLSGHRFAPETQNQLAQETASAVIEVQPVEPEEPTEEHANRKIGKGAILGYVSILFVAITGFLINPWLIANLGTSRYAIYTLVTSIVVMFGYDFGLEDTLTRFLSKALANKNKTEADQIIGQVSIVYLIIDAVMLVIFVLVYIFADKLFLDFTPTEMEIFRYAFLIMAVWSVINLPTNTLSGVLYSHEKFSVQKYGDITRRIFTLVGLVIVLLLNLGIYWVLAVQIISSALVIAYKLVYISDRFKHQPVFVMKDSKLLKTILRFSFWALIVSVIEKAMINLAPSFIGIVYRDAADYALQITVFNVSAQFFYYINEIAIVFSGLFIAKIARMIARGASKEEFDELYVKAGRYQVAVLLLLVTLFGVLGKDLVTLWLGPGFESVYVVAMLLIAPSLIVGPQIVLNTMLSAQNKVKYRSFVYLGTFILDIALTFVLAHFWGAVGAGIAYFASCFIGFGIAGNTVLSKQLGVSIPHFIKHAFLPMLLPAVSVLLVGLLMSLIPLSGWIALLFKGVILLLAYGLPLWFFVFNKTEKDRFEVVVDGWNAKTRDYLHRHIVNEKYGTG